MQTMWWPVAGYKTKKHIGQWEIPTAGDDSNNGKLIEVGKGNANVPGTKEHIKWYNFKQMVIPVRE